MSALSRRILDATRDIYLENGFRGVTMRKVADRIGVTAAAIYRHFSSKQDLIFHMIGQGFDLFGQYLYHSLEGKTPEERFQSAGNAYLQFALDQPRYYQILFMSQDWLGTIKIPAMIRKKGQATFQFLVRGVQECMAAKILRKEDPEAVAVTIWAHSHGLVSLYLSGELGDDAKRFKVLYQESMERLMKGLAE